MGSSQFDSKRDPSDVPTSIFQRRLIDYFKDFPRFTAEELTLLELKNSDVIDLIMQDQNHLHFGFEEPIKGALKAIKISALKKKILETNILSAQDFLNDPRVTSQIFIHKFNRSPRTSQGDLRRAMNEMPNFMDQSIYSSFLERYVRIVKDNQAEIPRQNDESLLGAPRENQEEYKNFLQTLMPNASKQLDELIQDILRQAVKDLCGPNGMIKSQIRKSLGLQEAKEEDEEAIVFNLLQNYVREQVFANFSKDAKKLKDIKLSNAALMLQTYMNIPIVMPSQEQRKAIIARPERFDSGLYDHWKENNLHKKPHTMGEVSRYFNDHPLKLLPPTSFEKWFETYNQLVNVICNKVRGTNINPMDLGTALDEKEVMTHNNVKPAFQNLMSNMLAQALRDLCDADGNIKPSILQTIELNSSDSLKMDELVFKTALLDPTMDRKSYTLLSQLVASYVCDLTFGNFSVRMNKLIDERTQKGQLKLAVQGYFQREFTGYFKQSDSRGLVEPLFLFIRNLVKLEKQLELTRVANGEDDSLYLAGMAFYDKANQLASFFFDKKTPVSDGDIDLYCQIVNLTACLIKNPDDNNIAKKLTAAQEKALHSKDLLALSHQSSIILSLANLKTSINACNNVELAQSGKIAYQQAGELASELIGAPKINVDEIQSFNRIVNNTTALVQKPDDDKRRNLLSAIKEAPLNKSKAWNKFLGGCLIVVGAVVVVAGLVATAALYGADIPFGGGMAALGAKVGLGLILTGAVMCGGMLARAAYALYQYKNRGAFTKALEPGWMGEKKGAWRSTLFKVADKSDKSNKSSASNVKPKFSS